VSFATPFGVVRVGIDEAEAGFRDMWLQSPGPTVGAFERGWAMRPREVGDWIRAEGAREFFAQRQEAGGEARPETPFPPASAAGCAGARPAWRALFALQQRLARDLFALIARGAGLAADGVLDGGGADSARSDVMRTYRYLRAPGAVVPGLRLASTSCHTDVGLLTLAPAASEPGLVLLSPDGERWVDVEGEGWEGGEEDGEANGRCSAPFIAFLGEAGARFLAQGPPPLLRAPVHFVDERGAARFSAPFFLRAPADALIAPQTTNADFLAGLMERPWTRMRPPKSAESFRSDF
jgi:isopenicillin N synthase-like dioxygenase